MRLMQMSNNFAREMNRLRRQLENANGVQTAATYPALNIWEDADSLHIESELPGFQPGDLEAFVVGQEQLVLKGERKPTNFEKSVCHRQERGFGKFERTLTLPVQVDGDKVEAKFNNGVLQLKLAKRPEAKPKKIEIAVG